MFTGIVEEIGKVLTIKKGSVSSRITFSALKVLENTQPGDSIAVNGVCLTATDISKGTFTADVMAETMRRSSLGTLSTGDSVNLERAMLCGGRFGGHIVSGHVDACGTILSLKQRDSDTELIVSVPDEIAPFLVEKGSIAVDGISLTLEAVENNTFRIGLIPTTLNHTNLSGKKAGAAVNLEADVIGKYVAAFLNRAGYGKKSQVTMQTLADAGFL